MIDDVEIFEHMGLVCTLTLMTDPKEDLPFWVGHVYDPDGLSHATGGYTAQENTLRMTKAKAVERYQVTKNRKE